MVAGQHRADRVSTDTWGRACARPLSHEKGAKIMPKERNISDGKIKIPVTTTLMPAYYKDFHCIMGACQDNCCDCGWKILFKKKDYLRLRRLEAPADFKEKLDKTVRRLPPQERETPDGTFYARLQADAAGRCPLHDADGKCSLQKMCGEDVLPFVCRSYPRKPKIYTAAALETALAPSCEGVLQLLWELRDGVDFIEEELPLSERRIVFADPSSLAQWFAPIRAMCVDILQNRALSMRQRMLLLGVALQAVRDMDWEGPDIKGWVDRFTPLTQGDAAKVVLAALPGNRPLYLSQHTMTAAKMIGAPWVGQLMGAIGMEITMNPSDMAAGEAKASVNYDAERYFTFEKTFQAEFGDMEYFFENLMVAVVMYITFPSLANKEELWGSYVGLCNLYGFYRFAAVAGCGESPTKARLFHILVNASRLLLHSNKRLAKLRDEFFDRRSSTLAHMAILIGD